MWSKLQTPSLTSNAIAIYAVISSTSDQNNQSSLPRNQKTLKVYTNGLKEIHVGPTCGIRHWAVWQHASVNLTAALCEVCSIGRVNVRCCLLAQAGCLCCCDASGASSLCCASVSPCVGLWPPVASGPAVCVVGKPLGTSVTVTLTGSHFLPGAYTACATGMVGEDAADCTIVLSLPCSELLSSSFSGTGDDGSSVWYTNSLQTCQCRARMWVKRRMISSSASIGTLDASGTGSHMAPNPIEFRFGVMGAGTRTSWRSNAVMEEWPRTRDCTFGTRLRISSCE